MSPPPRRLSFAVGTTLLTASLASGTLGCEKGNSVNVAHPPEDVHVNEGPAPEPDEPDDVDVDVDADADEEVEDEEPDGPHVNTVPDA
ncbi:hypothetical protein [Enhygromyxa salina]|uniref:Uncharacterized protein n=1 Tax=Enhygromyxa salina TaxID=215803 RepID=A0A2S9YTH1_9BACT|nr:hypothetical protein [Enhygromyxa salina]PRQ08393.1 hypothetical protein ENSA7_20200 [Enhygromyxa salina]